MPLDVIPAGQVVDAMTTLVASTTGEMLFMRPDQWFLPVGLQMDEVVTTAVANGRASRALYPFKLLDQRHESVDQRIRAGELVAAAPRGADPAGGLRRRGRRAAGPVGQADGRDPGDPAGPGRRRPAGPCSTSCGRRPRSSRVRGDEPISSPSGNACSSCWRAGPRTSRSPAPWASRCARCVAGSPSCWPSSASTPGSRPAWKRPGAAGSESAWPPRRVRAASSSTRLADTVHVRWRERTGRARRRRCTRTPRPLTCTDRGADVWTSSRSSWVPRLSRTAYSRRFSGETANETTTSTLPSPGRRRASSGVPPPT